MIEEKKLMNSRQKITIVLLLQVVLCSVAFAQVVEIPDPNLRAALHDALNIPRGGAITRDAMLKLVHFDAGNHDRNSDIASISGLEYATNLKNLKLPHNSFSDISPIVGLTKLTVLNLWGCRFIEDISPLRNLRNLEILLLTYSKVSDLRPLSGLTRLGLLELESNQIVDISPLASLINLQRLDLEGNQIVDFSPLSSLVNLEILWIHDNLGTDFTSLQWLTLTEFLFDEVCDMPPVMPSVMERITTRNLPSVFQAWDGVSQMDHLTLDEQNNLHDLHWSQKFKLDWDRTFDEPLTGLASKLAGDIREAVNRRQSKLQQNPNMIFIAGIRIRTQPLDWLPLDYFFLESDGTPVHHRADIFQVNFLLPEVQTAIINKVAGVAQCGLIDGVFFDGFFNHGLFYHGDHVYSATEEQLLQAWLNIFRGIRERVHDDFLIIINTNDTEPTHYAEYVNGIFMETGKDTPQGNSRKWIIRFEEILNWADSNLREPRITCLQGEGLSIEPPDGPNNLRWMRLFTTLSLTHSDGYVLYTDGMRDFNTPDNPVRVPSFQHIWYDFWDADLGQPVGPKAALYEDATPGLFIREFTNGWAVYNRSGSPQAVTLPEEVQGVSNGSVGTGHVLPDLDGEIYLRVKPKNPADVNGDGVVNILDLTLVAQGFGTDSLEADVNGDGVVNVFDLVFVAGEMQ